MVNEVAAPPVRARVPSTAGPWHLVGRFDTATGDTQPDRVSGPTDIDEVASWLPRFDEGLAAVTGRGSGVRVGAGQLTLAGRPVLPAPATPATVRSVASRRRSADDGPGTIDPSRPFLLAASEPPRNPGAGVADGAFELNGVIIPISGFDTLDEVLARIDRSGAGVVARFDPLVVEVVLTSVARGSAARILIGHDTSGFVAEFGLERPLIEPGHDAGFDRPLLALGGPTVVNRGLLAVNGIGIPIDPAVDSLVDVLDRITISSDVDAVFDVTTRRVVLGVDLPPGAFEIEDSTGFLDAVGFASGVYASAARGPGSHEALLVMRTSGGSGDRIASRIVEPGDSYRLAATRSQGDHLATRSGGPGNLTIADRLALTVEPTVSPPVSSHDVISIGRLTLPGSQRGGRHSAHP